MCVCVCACMCVYVCVNVRVCVCMCVSLCVYVCYSEKNHMFLIEDDNDRDDVCDCDDRKGHYAKGDSANTIIIIMRMMVTMLIITMLKTQL